MIMIGYLFLLYLVGLSWKIYDAISISRFTENVKKLKNITGKEILIVFGLTTILMGYLCYAIYMY